MTHEADSGLAVIVLSSCLGDRRHNSLKVLIARQKRFGDGYLLKCVRTLCNLIDKISVLQTIHQMGRLNHKSLYAILLCTVKCLGHIIDDLVVTGLYMVNDDLARKCTANGIIRKCLLDRILDCTNGHATVVIVARSEADYHQLILADLILISRIILGSITGIVVLFLFFLGLCGLCLSRLLCSGLLRTRLRLGRLCRSLLR